MPASTRLPGANTRWMRSLRPPSSQPRPTRAPGRTQHFSAHWPEQFRCRVRQEHQALRPRASPPVAVPRRDVQPRPVRCSEPDTGRYGRGRLPDQSKLRPDLRAAQQPSEYANDVALPVLRWGRRFACPRSRSAQRKAASFLIGSEQPVAELNRTAC